MKTIAIVSADAHIRPHEQLLTKVYSKLKKQKIANAILVDLSAFALMPQTLEGTGALLEAETIASAIRESQQKADRIRLRKSGLYVLKHPFVKPNLNELDYVRPSQRVARLETWTEILNYQSCEGIAIGQVPALDLVLSKKKRLAELSDTDIMLYKTHLVAADLAQQAIQQALSKHQFGSVVFYNDYTIQQALRMQCQHLGLSTAKIAGIPGDASELDGFFVSNMYGIEERYAKRLLWPAFGISGLTTKRIKQVYAELQKRSFNPTVHTYSPSAEAGQSASKQLQLPSNKKIITLFTSSPEESDKDVILATLSPLQFPRDRSRYNSHNHLLEDFLDLARAYHEDACFVIRIHPRSGKDKRGGGESTYLAAIDQIFSERGHEHVIVVRPESPVSSYWLGLRSDYAIVQASSIGLELACMGVRVGVACIDDGLFSAYPLSKAYDRPNNPQFLRQSIEAVVSGNAQNEANRHNESIMEALSVFCFQEYEFMHQLSSLSGEDLLELLTTGSSVFVQFEAIMNQRRQRSAPPFTDAVLSNGMASPALDDSQLGQCSSEIDHALSGLLREFGFERDPQTNKIDSFPRHA